MGWLFRRRAAGRHGLGAAVTSIPSGPLVVPVPVAPVAPVDPHVAAALARAQAEATLLPALPLDEVARLLGEADEGPPAAAAEDAPPGAESVVRPAVADDVPAPVEPSVLPVAVGSVALAPEPLPPTPAGFFDAVFGLPEEVLDVPVPFAEAYVPVQPEPASRVQLGFRDGSTRAVDDVDQARALEELARALTSSG